MQSNLDSSFKNFVYGFTTPIRAITLCVSRPKLLALSSLPFVITLLAVGGAIYGILSGAWHFHDQVFAWAGSYSLAASKVALFFLGAILLYVSFQTTGLLISLLSSPFNDFLAEATERNLGAPPIETTWLSLLRVFFLDLRKTAIALFGLLFFSVLGLVPAIGFFSIFGFALIEAFTFVTYPQSRRHHGILQSLIWMKNNFAVSLGFGFATLLLFGVPPFSLIAVPVSVIGGTMIFLGR